MTTNATPTPSAGRTTTNIKALRVFIGIRVASGVARQLVELARPLERYAVRLVSVPDIHLTLVPPWNEVRVPAAIETLRTAVGESVSFLLTDSHLGYGPRSGIRTLYGSIVRLRDRRGPAVVRPRAH